MEIDDVTTATGSIFLRRPALSVLVLYIAGILASLKFGLYHSYSLIFTPMILFAAVVLYLKGNKRAAGILSAILIISLGWFRADISTGPHPPNHIENLALIGGRVQLSGKVVAEPDIRDDRTYLVVEADSVLLGKHRIPSFGKLRVKVKGGGSRYDHADILQMAGYLYVPSGPRNPGGFDYGAYLRTKGIFAAMSVNGPHDVTISQESRSFLASVIRPLRSYLISTAKEYLSPVPAAILSGFILGERRDIPDEYQTLFRDTGTLHLMAVSGSNVGMVAGLFAFPLTLLRIPRRLKVLILLVCITFFAILTRLEPSVIRASIMASIGLIAYGWLRKPDFINLLGFAGLVMLLWRPLQLFDVGLQLSFAATFAILYALPKLLSWFRFLSRHRLKWLLWIIVLSLSTLAAQAAVMPLMARYFNSAPLAGLIANIPVGILANFSTGLGVTFYFLSLLGNWMSDLIAAPLGIILESVIYLLRLFSSLPYANIKVASPGWPEIFLYWILLYTGYEIAVNRRLSKTGIITALFVFNLMVWSDFLKTKPAWELEFLDMGRNRAWIYSDESGRSVACFDSYKPIEEAKRVFIPHILNHHGGKLEYLFSSTPDSPEVAKLRRQFTPRLISAEDMSRFEHGRGRHEHENDHRLPEGVKIVWAQSDNNVEGNRNLPGLQIDAPGGIMLMAAWSGAEAIGRFQIDGMIRILEMPWGAYSKGLCRSLIDNLSPEYVVFSPDRYSVVMPGRRGELTHSENRVFSTSICGGFEFANVGRDIRVRTMKPVSPEER